MDIFLLTDLEFGLLKASDSKPAAAPETQARATGEATLRPAAQLLFWDVDKNHWISHTNDSDIRQPERQRSQLMDSRENTTFQFVPIRHPHLKKDAEKLGEDREMIKGLEKRNFKDGLQTLFSPEERRLGRDLTTIFKYMKGCYRGRVAAVCHLHRRRRKAPKLQKI